MDQNLQAASFALLDPSEHCRIVGHPSDWTGLPPSKSLFQTPDGCGLPIGNLTSQLFSNVYLNVLDQWMKRDLGCRHYGRYVDDFYVVSCGRRWLEAIVPQVNSFLNSSLGLSVQASKTEIRDVRCGVQFLGAFLLPYRRYASKDQFLPWSPRTLQVIQHLPEIIRSRMIRLLQHG